jgi:acetoacetyl-CoA synthetase
LDRLAVRAHSDMRGVEDADVLWRPAADARETTRMGHYMTWLAENRGLVFDSYAQLWEWSVTDLAGFWASIWDFFEVHA